MAKMEYTWPTESIDAIGIRVRDANVSVLGTDADEVRLESNGSDKYTTRLNVYQIGCWLWITTPSSKKDVRLTLLLPKRKAWPIDLYASNVNFRADNVRERLNLILAKGEIQLNDCRGAFNLASGNGNVVLRRFSEEEVPEMPPLPDSERKKRRKSLGIDIYMDMHWRKDDWAQWGLDFSEKMVKGFLGQKDGAGKGQGINVKMAKGDFQMEDTNAETCTIRAARSDVKMKGVRISKLDLNVIKGDIKSDSGIPGDDWKIKTHSGDITLSLPCDVNARIDAATRHGDINSVTPLIRVTRQGPEPWHGRRMVGIIGSVPDKKVKIPEIRLSVLRGDIKVETKPVASRYAGESEVPEPPSPPPPPPAGKTVDSYQTQIDVLKALSEGRITVKKAERILDSLESGKKVT